MAGAARDLRALNQADETSTRGQRVCIRPFEGNALNWPSERAMNCIDVPYSARNSSSRVPSATSRQHS